MVELQSTRCHKRQNSPSSTITDGSPSVATSTQRSSSITAHVLVTFTRTNQRVPKTPSPLSELSNNMLVSAVSLSSIVTLTTACVSQRLFSKKSPSTSKQFLFVVLTRTIRTAQSNTAFACSLTLILTFRLCRTAQSLN